MAFFVGRPALAQVTGAEDHLLAIARQPLVIQPSHLMGNDPNDFPVHLTIDSLPNHGTLTFVPHVGGDYYEYVSGKIPGEERLFFGLDSFTYTLAGNGFESAPVTVFINVKPRWIPLSGRWVEPGNDGSSDSAVPGTVEGGGVTALGGTVPGTVEGGGVTAFGGPVPKVSVPGTVEGDDWQATTGTTGGLGFYNSADAYFRLCELNQGPVVENCEDFAVPSPFATPGLHPVIGDWDEDGDDEVGVFHAGTGRFLQFDLYRKECLIGSTCLVLVGDVISSERSVLPVVGQWGLAGRNGEQYGLYEPATGWLELIFKEEEQSLGWQLGAPSWSEAQTVAGRWRTELGETPGVYNPSTGWFSYAEDVSGNVVSGFQTRTEDGVLHGGVAFGATDFTGARRFLGLFFEDQRMTYLFATDRWGSSQVLVRVPTDPDGGCCR